MYIYIYVYIYIYIKYIHSFTYWCICTRAFICIRIFLSLARATRRVYTCIYMYIHTLPRHENLRSSVPPLIIERSNKLGGSWRRLSGDKKIYPPIFISITQKPKSKLIKLKVCDKDFREKKIISYESLCLHSGPFF